MNGNRDAELARDPIAMGLKLAGRAGGKVQRAPLGRKPERGREPDAPGRTGHQDAFALQFHFHSSTPEPSECADKVNRAAPASALPQAGASTPLLRRRALSRSSCAGP